MNSHYVLFVRDLPRSHFFAGWKDNGEPLWIDHIEAALRLERHEALGERTLLKRETGDAITARLVLAY